MKIQIKQTIEDYLHFYTFIEWNTPNHKTTRFRNMAVLVLFIFIFMPYQDILKSPTTEVIKFSIFIIVLIVLIILFSGKEKQKSIRKRIRKSFKLGYNDISFGDIMIEMNDAEILVKSDKYEKRYQWNNFEFYNLDKEHVYIYNSRLDSIVIKKEFISDFDQFDNYVKERIK